MVVSAESANWWPMCQTAVSWNIEYLCLCRPPVA